MRNSLPKPNTPSFIKTTDANDTKMDIERLDSEAQTHDRRRDDSGKYQPSCWTVELGD
jgi:hypothetical protein